MTDHPTRADIALLDPDFHQDPFERYAWMRAHAPVYWDAGARTWDGGQGLWGVTRYEDIRAVASNQALFCSGNSSRPDSPPVPSMINQDEPVHLARRGVIRRRFTPQAVRSYEAFARRCVTRLIGQVAERGECDFVRDIATPLPMLIIGELLGVPETEHLRRAGFAEHGFRIVVPERLGERFERWGFELLEIRRTGDSALLVGRRMADADDDGL